MPNNKSHKDKKINFSQKFKKVLEKNTKIRYYIDMCEIFVLK
jgi:hypothetical protein